MTPTSRKRVVKSKRVKLMPLAVIRLLYAAFQFYKEEWGDKRDWEYIDEVYMEVLHAYHVYAGIKKDYRKEYTFPLPKRTGRGK